MLISEILEIYRVRRALRPASLYQMRRTVDLFGEFLRQPASVRDFDADSVSRWLLALESTHSPASRAGHRAKLLILWRFAARHGYVAEPDASEIRPAPRPEPNPVAWSQEEVEALLVACGQCRRFCRGRCVGPYFAALVRAGWETGLRRSDLWRMRREDIGEAAVVTRQQKTGAIVSHPLTAETRAAILDLPGDRPLRWWGCQRQFYTAWAAVLGLAKIGPGALQRLRRSAATAVARDEGTDAAREFLGHRTVDMWTRYVDRRLAWPRRFTPPRLVG